MILSRLRCSSDEAAVRDLVAVVASRSCRFKRVVSTATLAAWRVVRDETLACQRLLTASTAVASCDEAAAPGDPSVAAPSCAPASAAAGEVLVEVLLWSPVGVLEAGTLPLLSFGCGVGATPTVNGADGDCWRGRGREGRKMSVLACATAVD